ncbi:MAG: hypothetical protein HC897_02950 [Thermoanaerobaculia bacterium]|nr:hypothetical protein [Thermoanaerobaculia bacterium]
MTWEDQDSELKSIVVEPVDDREAEPNKTLELALSSPQGGLTVAEPAHLRVDFQDDDTAVPLASWREICWWSSPSRRSSIGIRSRASSWPATPAAR